MVYLIDSAHVQPRIVGLLDGKLLRPLGRYVDSVGPDARVVSMAIASDASWLMRSH